MSVDPGLSQFMDHLGDYHVLTREEEADLFRRLEAGDNEARELLVLHNLKLVVHIAKTYRHKGLPFSDVIQEGTVGLLRAIDKFEIARGNKFSTYATWWILQAVQRSVVNQAPGMRVPLHVSTWQMRARKYRRDHPNAPPEEVARAIDATVEQLALADHAARTVHSLDREMSRAEFSGSMTLMDILADRDAVDPQDLPSTSDYTPLWTAISELSELEREVVELRFGFRGDVRSIAEIARELEVPQQAASAAHRTALGKLRRHLGTAVEDSGTVGGREFESGERRAESSVAEDGQGPSSFPVRPESLPSQLSQKEDAC